jgi:O-antigen ligase
MDTGTKSFINQLYFFSFIAAIVLLPWSLRWCNYALMVTAVAGLMSTSWKEKIALTLAHKEVFVFLALFALYLVGLLYTQDTAIGLKSVEKKSILIFPLLVASSVSITNHQRILAQLFFIGSIAVFTIACIALNVIVVSKGAPYPQVNFDAHTLARFSEFHPNADPLWMQFSYIAFGHPLIKSTTVYSLYLSLSIFMLFHLQAESRTSATIKYIVMTTFCMVIILLASRIGIFILFTVGAFNVFRKFKNVRTRYALISVIPVLLLLLLLVSPVTRYRAIEEPLNTPLQYAQDSNRWNSFNLRLLEWSSSLKGIKEHALTGSGTGGARGVLNTYYDEVALGDFDFSYGSNNQFLEVYLEIGIAGFIALALCFIAPFLIARKNGDIILMSLVLMMALACISNSMFESARALPFYMVFVSLFMFTRKKYDSEVAR